MQNTFYIRFNQSTKFVNGFFPKYENGSLINYTNNAEFQQMRDNKNYIEGTEENRNWCFAQARTPKVINGILQPDTQTQAEIDADKLAEAKKTAKITIESARKKVQYENVTYKGKTYFATPTAQINLTTTLLQLMLIILKEKNIITDADLQKLQKNWLNTTNEQVSLTGVDIDKLFNLIYNNVSPLYINEAIAQNTVVNATTVTQVEEVLSSGSYTVTQPTTTTGSESLFGGDIAPSSSI